MKYDVHLFTIVRVKVCNVEANSHSEAAKKVSEQVDMDTLFKDTHVVPHQNGSQSITTEWSEEHSHALVDVVGDDKYDQSMWLDKDLSQPMNSTKP